MKIKHSIFNIVSTSILIDILINLILLPWIIDIITLVFNDNIQIFILAEIILLGILIGILYLIYFTKTYEFSDKEIITETKIFKRLSIKVFPYRSTDIIIDERFNLLLDIFSLERLIIYDAKLHKIVSIIMSKNNAVSIINLLKEIRTEKAPYTLGRDFFFDSKNIFQNVLNSLIVFSLIYLLSILVIFAFDIVYIGAFNFLLVYSLFLLFLLVLYNTIYIAHNLNTQIKINNYNLRLERGTIFKRKLFMSLKGLDAVSLRSIMFSKAFDLYSLRISLSRFSSILIPFRYEYIIKLFRQGNIDAFKSKTKLNVLSLVLFIIITLAASISIAFFRPLLSPFIAIIFTILYLEVFTEILTNIDSNTIALSNGIFNVRTKYITLKIIKKVKINRMLFNQNLMTVYTYKKQYRFFINNIEKENIRANLK